MKLTRTDMKFVPKPWGSELWITNNELYCGKVLVIHKNAFCSFHYHKVKDEVLYVEVGKMAIYTENLEGTNTCLEILWVGDGWRVLPETVHQIYGIQDTVLYEFSTHHDDSDSYRITRDLKINLEELWKLP